MSAPATENKSRTLLNEALGLKTSVSRVESHVRKSLDPTTRVGKRSFPVVTTLVELVAKGIIVHTANKTIADQRRQVSTNHFRDTPPKELESQPWWCMVQDLDCVKNFEPERYAIKKPQPASDAVAPAADDNAIVPVADAPAAEGDAIVPAAEPEPAANDTSKEDFMGYVSKIWKGIKEIDEYKDMRIDTTFRHFVSDILEELIERITKAVDAISKTTAKPQNTITMNEYSFMQVIRSIMAFHGRPETEWVSLKAKFDAILEKMHGIMETKKEKSAELREKRMEEKLNAMSSDEREAYDIEQARKEAEKLQSMLEKQEKRARDMIAKAKESKEKKKACEDTIKKLEKK